MPQHDAKDGVVLHPIQLLALGVKELFLRSNRPPDPETGADAGQCILTVSHSAYDRQTRRIMVSLKLESGVGIPETEAPYAMRIELAGIFELDEELFPAEDVSDWAVRGAPLILFPYIREHAFGLSSRCGFRPLLLPLLQVPVFRIEKPKIRTKRSKVTPGS